MPCRRTSAWQHCLRRQGTVQELNSWSVSEPLLPKSTGRSGTLPSAVAPAPRGLADSGLDRSEVPQQHHPFNFTLNRNTTTAASDSRAEGPTQHDSLAPASSRRGFSMPSIRSVHSVQEDPGSPGAALQGSPFAEAGAGDAFAAWPSGHAVHPVQRPEGRRLEYRHQAESLSRDWLRRHGSLTARSVGPQAAVLNDGATLARWPPSQTFGVGRHAVNRLVTLQPLQYLCITCYSGVWCLAWTKIHNCMSGLGVISL